MRGPAELAPGLRLSRRALLAGTAAAVGGASTILPGRTRAAGGPRHLLACRFGGGWDLLLSLDPRDPARFTAARAPETGIEPAYDRVTRSETPLVRPLGDDALVLGPFMGALAERRHAERLCVVRGLAMGTLDHAAGASRFAFGRTPAAPSGGLVALAPGWPALAAHFDLDPARAAPPTPAGRAAQAAFELFHGGARAVEATLASDLDTHFDNWQDGHGPSLARAFDAFARLLDLLQGTEYPGAGGASWLDHTVVLGWSELGRAPRLNARGGRDHGSTNACVLAGGGVRGGRVLGASSDDGLQPRPIDLATGAAVEAAGPDHPVAEPAHVRAAISEALDLRLSTLDEARPLRAIFG